MGVLLALEGVDARYGPVQALRDVSLTVDDGEVVAILGANGAGKTTTLRAVSGTVRRSGRIELRGRSVARKGPEALARLGVAHVPEGRGTFAELTVWENLRLGAHVRRGALRDDFRRVAEFFPWLAERRSQQAGTLSGGEQQMLALARAMMQRPRLLLLDEPSLGLAPIVVGEIFRILGELNEREETAILLVEQNARTSLALATRAYVLEVGEVAFTGTSEELSSNDSIRKSYLGY
jgi:branched-chain amino acid transport system ATP-binding protein